MRVLINGVSALKPKTGVGHTTAYLHRALARLHPEETFWLYPGETVAGLVLKALPGSPPRPGVAGAAGAADAPGPLTPGTLNTPPRPPRTARVRTRLTELAKSAYRLHLRLAARWGGFDLYHEPNFVPVRTHLPTVVTVHDLSVLLYPQWHPADRVKHHETHFRRGVAAADHVVVVSHSVRREVIAHLGLPPDRVTAAVNGIGEHFHPQSPEHVESVRRRLGLPPRYLLYVGTIEPRKNVRTLLRAFCDLPAELRERCPLVLAGGWGWKSEPERELYESEARHRGAIHLGYVADADLPGIYAGADALLYPSYYEGFGLPPVEMLACGGAVIASTADALREVVAGHGLLLDPADLAGWRDAMRRVAAEPDWRGGLSRGGVAHARRFTWESAARTVLGVYRHVLGIAEPSVTDRIAA